MRVPHDQNIGSMEIKRQSQKEKIFHERDINQIESPSTTLNEYLTPSQYSKALGSFLCHYSAMTSPFKSLKMILVFSFSAHVAGIVFIGLSTDRQAVVKTSQPFALSFGAPKKLGTAGVAKQVLKKEVITQAPAHKSKSSAPSVPLKVAEVPATVAGPIGNGGSLDGVANSNGNGGSPDGVNTPQARYNTLLSSIINKHKHYPRMARALHHEGRVLIEVTLDKDGNLINLEIIEKASFDTLTKAAVQTIRNVGKFPPLPKELGKDVLTFKVPVDYKITI
jgi:TonB family protein